MYDANEGSDDVIDRSTKTVQHSIKNISGNIGAVIFKLGTRNVRHKRNKRRAHPVTPSISLSISHVLDYEGDPRSSTIFCAFLFTFYRMARLANIIVC